MVQQSLPFETERQRELACKDASYLYNGIAERQKVAMVVRQQDNGSKANRE